MKLVKSIGPLFSGAEVKTGYRILFVMIVALVWLTDATDLRVSGDESALEQTLRKVLRGPFAGTVVVGPEALSTPIKECVSGFAVQTAFSPPTELWPAGMRAAIQLRERWQRAMAAANQRFAGNSKKGGKDTAAPTGEWGMLQKSSDVKLRGLARSFDRDGIMIFKASDPSLLLETQAALVERFGRDGAQGTPILRAVAGYPVLCSFDLAAAELPKVQNSLEEWLKLKNESISII